MRKRTTGIFRQPNSDERTEPSCRSKLLLMLPRNDGSLLRLGSPVRLALIRHNPLAHSRQSCGKLVGPYVRAASADRCSFLTAWGVQAAWLPRPTLQQRTARTVAGRWTAMQTNRNSLLAA